MFVSLKKPDENKLGDAPLENNSIEVIVDEALTIDRKTRVVRCKSDNKYHYEKLILSTGSSPILPPVPGIDKKGVYPIYKDLEYLKKSIEQIYEAKDVLIIGGGFIGVEFADELSRIHNLNVYMVEILPNLLSNSFDIEFSSLAAEALKARGVSILTDIRVDRILGDRQVAGVHLSDGRKIAVGSIILGVGGVPNTKLAQMAGLSLGEGKGIWVDEYMRTIDPDIFAVGDCAEKKDFYTRKPANVMLASTATAEARVAGANLYQLKVVRENKGTISIYSTYIDGKVLGSAGLTEASAKKEGFEIVTGRADGVDRHPTALPGASKVKVKLVFSRHSGIILGGQVAGGETCGELINLIGVAIQKRMSFAELETLQMATHPYLTSAPTVYPIVLAAQDAADKM
jgi:NADPH-dependent 2,4-dienoyl-CoA reductase/sulfur reductase-like enzyme